MQRFFRVHDATAAAAAAVVEADADVIVVQGKGEAFGEFLQERARYDRAGFGQSARVSEFLGEVDRLPCCRFRSRFRFRRVMDRDGLVAGELVHVAEERGAHPRGFVDAFGRQVGGDVDPHNGLACLPRQEPEGRVAVIVEEGEQFDLAERNVETRVQHAMHERLVFGQETV